MSISADSAVKRERGRPRLLTDQAAALIRSLYGSLTPRRMHEVYYEIRARRAIGEPAPPEYAWLIGGGRDAAYRRSILAALGRIEDRDLLLAVAKQVCVLKPKARDAVAMIRRARYGESPAEAGSLARELLRVVDAYRVRYPSESWAAIRREVEDVLETVDVLIDGS
jgi:hypothetical protein